MIPQGFPCPWSPDSFCFLFFMKNCILSLLFVLLGFCLLSLSSTEEQTRSERKRTRKIQTCTRRVTSKFMYMPLPHENLLDMYRNMGTTAFFRYTWRASVGIASSPMRKSARQSFETFCWGLSVTTVVQT